MVEKSRQTERIPIPPSLSNKTSAEIICVVDSKATHVGQSAVRHDGNSMLSNVVVWVVIGAVVVVELEYSDSAAITFVRLNYWLAVVWAVSHNCRYLQRLLGHTLTKLWRHVA